MSHTSETILNSAAALPEGGLLLPKDFLRGAGSRNAIDKAFSRLTRNGTLFRVSRGMYVAARVGRFGVRPPSTESVLRAIANLTGETIVPSRAARANAAGMSRHVPVREIYETSGPSRVLQLGNRSVELRQALVSTLKVGA